MLHFEVILLFLFIKYVPDDIIVTSRKSEPLFLHRFSDNCSRRKKNSVIFPHTLMVSWLTRDASSCLKATKKCILHNTSPLNNNCFLSFQTFSCCVCYFVHLLYNHLRVSLFKKVVNYLLKRLELSYHGNIITDGYSCGTRRKLSTALALIGHPQIMLLVRRTHLFTLL